MMAVGGLIYAWIDILWLPVALASVHKGQRLKACGFVIFCMLTMRMQIELLKSVDFDGGFFTLMDAPLFQRGLIVYGFFTVAYLVLAHFSPKTTGAVFMAASLSIFITAFAVSSLVMIL